MSITCVIWIEVNTFNFDDDWNSYERMNLQMIVSISLSFQKKKKIVQIHC